MLLDSISSNRRCAQLNKAVQNLVFSILKDDSELAAKKSLDVMVELYRKRVWVVSQCSVVEHQSPRAICDEAKPCGQPCVKRAIHAISCLFIRT